MLKRVRYGTGELVWSGLPFELAQEPGVTRVLYQQFLSNVSAPGEDYHRALLISRQALRSGKLILVVSEAGRAQEVTLAEEGLRLTIEANRAGALLLAPDGTTTTFGGLTLIA
jgi:hypothetical protein